MYYRACRYFVLQASNVQPDVLLHRRHLATTYTTWYGDPCSLCFVKLFDRGVDVCLQSTVIVLTAEAALGTSATS